MGLSRSGTFDLVNMFSRAALTCSPASTQVRGMATLRDINNRLKAVKNIQKITKSMKIVSAAKFSRAEKELKGARSYGQGATAFYEKAEVQQDPKKPNHLVIAMSSDRGLCGGIHSNIFKAIRADLAEKAAGTNVKIIAVGDKQKALMSRNWKDNILMHFADVGRKTPTFADATLIAASILDCGFELTTESFIIMYSNLLFPIR